MNRYPRLGNLWTVLESADHGGPVDTYAVTHDADGIAYLHVMGQARAEYLAQSIREATGHRAAVVPACDHAPRFAGIEHHTARGPRRIRKYPPGLYRSAGQ